MYYRKKPVTIEAREFTEHNQEALADWCHGRLRGTLLEPKDRVIQIDTLEGEMEARPNEHWIIKGSHGEFYPIRKDIFIDNYEQVKVEL